MLLHEISNQNFVIQHLFKLWEPGVGFCSMGNTRFKEDEVGDCTDSTFLQTNTILKKEILDTFLVKYSTVN